MRFLPLLLVLACAGPTRLTASATSPPPGASQPPPRVFIYTRDNLLPDNFILRQEAALVPLSADESRVELRLVFAAEAMTEPDRWEVYLVDGAGRRLEAVDHELRRGRLSVSWDLEPRDPAATEWVPVRRIPGRDVYEARGSYRFRAPHLLDSPALTVVARRGDYELRWQWRFADGPVVVRHHGPRPERYDNAIVVPGPLTDVAWRE